MSRTRRVTFTRADVASTEVINGFVMSNKVDTYPVQLFLFYE